MTKDYNKIEVKDNMKVDNNDEELAVREKPKMERLVTGEKKVVKRSLMGRLVTGIIGPDGLPGIGSYVNEEIIKPAIKNIIVDAVTSGINMVMYGERGGAPRGRHSGGRSNYAPRTNYNDSYGRRPSEPVPAERVARPVRQGFQDYIIQNRDEASQVLVSLTEAADMYNSVSVADYYDTIGVPSNYTDNNYGWTYDSISRATIIPARGGYIIKFPPVEVI